MKWKTLFHIFLIMTFISVMCVFLTIHHPHQSFFLGFSVGSFLFAVVFGLITAFKKET